MTDFVIVKDRGGWNVREEKVPVGTMRKAAGLVWTLGRNSMRKQVWTCPTVRGGIYITGVAMSYPYVASDPRKANSCRDFEAAARLLIKFQNESIAEAKKLLIEYDIIDLPTE